MLGWRFRVDRLSLLQALIIALLAWLLHRIIKKYFAYEVRVSMPFSAV